MLSQVVSEQILTAFQTPRLQCCFKCQVMFLLSCPVLSLSEARGPVALYLKTRGGGSQGLYIVSFSGAKLTNKSINLIAFAFT